MFIHLFRFSNRFILVRVVMESKLILGKGNTPSEHLFIAARKIFIKDLN